MRKPIGGALLLNLTIAFSAWAAAKASFTFDAMMKLARIDDPQISPDGKTVAFTVQTVDMANNTRPAAIYSVPVEGGTPLKLTTQGMSNARPRWTPDSKRILFVSDAKNGNQIWSMNADGSDQKPITDLPTGAENHVISPDGKLLLFTSDVFPSCPTSTGYDVACNKAAADAENASKMKARVYTSLL